MATRQELETRLAQIPSHSKLTRMTSYELATLRKEQGMGVVDFGGTKAGQVASLEALRTELERRIELRTELERRIEWHVECEVLVAEVATELGLDPVKLHAWASTNGLNPLRSMRAKAREVAAFKASLV